MNLQQVFTKIYSENLWGNEESVSGSGSTIGATAMIRPKLEYLFAELNIKSLLDAPCGDHNWMSQVNLDGIQYLGIDICQDVVDSNNKRWASLNRQFKFGDITNELPTSDMVLVRDCLVHFPIEYIFKAIKAIKASGSKWLLTTSFTGDVSNHDISVGDWRPIALTNLPFNFPEPVFIIDEEHPHKKLMLWRVNELPN
jgi:2-polyprenyl-3-methyl-5-hydroxy-6-metoxy-1,4-benzoquinol methylase